MALSPSGLGSIIDGNLAAQGAIGANRTVFANAVAAGIVQSIVGKAFVTADTGLTPGVGAGSGTGITGLDSSSMVSTSMGDMFHTGENAMKMFQAIHEGVVTHLSASASLISVDSPVYLGAGTIVPGTIAVVVSEMASNIDSSLSAANANGENRTKLAHAIALGVCTAILATGTGSLTIVGSPITPPPVPGSGSGTGTVS